jgi:arylsulfatase A-like enzyme
MREIYDQEISYLDENIGDLLNLIDELKIADNTILILTSDHGENFGEHGFFEHQLCLYNSLLHVPLIIRYPKLLPQGTEDTSFSLVGLYRTIAELVNGEDTRSNLASESWISAHGEIEGNMIIAEYANGLEMLRRAISEEAPGFDYSRYDRELKSMIIGDYKYIWDSIGGEELFNLGTDPFEEHDIAAKEPDLARSLRQILLATTSGERSSSKPGSPPPIDDATRDALKALGYETEN